MRTGWDEALYTTRRFLIGAFVGSIVANAVAPPKTLSEYALSLAMLCAVSITITLDVFAWHRERNRE